MEPAVSCRIVPTPFSVTGAKLAAIHPVDRMSAVERLKKSKIERLGKPRERRCSSIEEGSD
jgi:hypothetical protein